MESGSREEHVSEERKPVHASSSRTLKTVLVLPPDTNHMGTIFGGKVMSYIDEIAAMSAMRHAQQPVVTASIDSVVFRSPVKEGDILTLEGFVTWTGTTSMEVFVKVTAEKFPTVEKRLTATSFVTMVAVDKEGRPSPVSPVIPETEMEKKLFETASDRQRERIKRKRELEDYEVLF